MAKPGLFGIFVAWPFGLGWNAAAAGMTSRVIHPPSPLRVAAGAAGVTATALAYWYWDGATISMGDLMESAWMAVLKVFVISAAIVAGSGAVSLLWPAHRVAADRLWLIRRLGGPAIAISTILGSLGAILLVGHLSSVDYTHPLLRLALVLTFLPLIGAFIGACVLGVRHQFRLAEAHRDLAAVCIAFTGVWGLVEAISRTVGGGIGDHMPVVVWMLVTFVGPIATITLASLDIYTARQVPAA